MNANIYVRDGVLIVDLRDFELDGDSYRGASYKIDGNILEITARHILTKHITNHSTWGDNVYDEKLIESVNDGYVFMEPVKRSWFRLFMKSPDRKRVMFGWVELKQWVGEKITWRTSHWRIIDNPKIK